VRLAPAIGLAGALALSSACSRPETTPTFAVDVAPLVYTRCAPCHHRGGAGPFPLTTYDEVRRRSRQIAEVTGRRYMPPWPPVEGHGDFVGERRLSDREIARLAAWVKAGSPKGDLAAVPASPTFPASWQLGTPDLVLTAPPGFVLDAEGDDRFHNFVLPVPVSGTRYVRAIEILPGAPRLVHHANVLVDRSGWARERDAADPAVGFPGMDLEIVSDRFDPDSHFLFWKPGSPPVPEPDDMAWRLDRGADLVLNMHLQPSGKREEVRPSIGLYFTDRVPTRMPMLLQLEHDGALDIPAGDSAFTVTDELTLPVDVTLLAVYPHAHYVGHEIRGTARLPDGSTRWLVHIADWDLNWQAVYRLRQPMSLPKGTVVSMKWTYDNSSGNERNPHDPPERVRAGDRASDEMAHLWLQVLPGRSEDRALLQEATMRARLRKYPGDFVALANLGSVLESAGKSDEAIGLLRAAVAARPDHAQARNMLGTALQARGQLDDAMTEFVEAARLRPGYLDPEYNLGNVLLAKGQPAQAVPRFERVLQASPDDAAALSDLGSAYAMLGRFDRATRCFERSLTLQPRNAQAVFNLGLIAARRANLAEARRRFEQAVAMDPSNQDYRSALDDATASIRRQ
jgi:Flp pilus assembly protein TadD/mono/diheme cytochrome c family protein